MCLRCVFYADQTEHCKLIQQTLHRVSDANGSLYSTFQMKVSVIFYTKAVNATMKMEAERKAQWHLSSLP